MRGDPLALEKDLDGSRRQPYLNLAAGGAGRDALEVPLVLDVLIEPDPAQPPFGKGIGLAGQRLQMRPIEFLEQRAAGDAEAPDRPLLVELAQQLADCRVQFGQAVKAPMTQPAQKPAFDDQHGRLDLRLIARAPRAGWQHRRVVMRRHLGVGAVDLWLLQTSPYY